MNEQIKVVIKEETIKIVLTGGIISSVDFSSATTDDLQEGDQNLYQTTQEKTDNEANTAARHTHANKTILDNIQQAFTTALKNAYDSAVSHISSVSNPHNVTKAQIGLSNVQNVDTTTTANIADTAAKRFTNDTEKANWNNKQKEVEIVIGQSGDVDVLCTSSDNFSVKYLEAYNLAVASGGPRVITILPGYYYQDTPIEYPFKPNIRTVGLRAENASDTGTGVTIAWRGTGYNQVAPYQVAMIGNTLVPTPSATYEGSISRGLTWDNCTFQGGNIQVGTNVTVRCLRNFYFFNTDRIWLGGEHLRLLGACINIDFDSDIEDEAFDSSKEAGGPRMSNINYGASGFGTPTTIVTSEAEMLALSTTLGRTITRSDLSKDFYLATTLNGGATNINNWVETFPTAHIKAKLQTQLWEVGSWHASTPNCDYVWYFDRVDKYKASNFEVNKIKKAVLYLTDSPNVSTHHNTFLGVFVQDSSVPFVITNCQRTSSYNNILLGAFGFNTNPQIDLGPVKTAVNGGASGGYFRPASDNNKIMRYVTQFGYVTSPVTIQDNGNITTPGASIYSRTAGTVSNTSENISSTSATGALDIAARGDVRIYIDSNNGGTTDALRIYGRGVGGTNLRFELFEDGGMRFAQANTIATPGAGFTLFADSNNRLSWRGTNGFNRTFDATTITADRTYTLQDASGTLAFTSDIYMSSTDKTKLDGIATGATANATDAQLRDRATHTGTQTASTISDFASTVRSTILTGLSNATNAIISASDTILTALGKLQKQTIDLEMWKPADSGYKAWAYDPIAAVNPTQIGQGTLVGARMCVKEAMTITNLLCAVGTAGSNVTNAFMALYDDSGALLGQSSNNNTAFNTTGIKACTLSAPVNITPGFYNVCFWVTSTTTQPSMARGSGTPQIANAGTSGATSRFFTANTSLTTSAPATLGGKTQTNAFWFGMS